MSKNRTLANAPHLRLPRQNPRLTRTKKITPLNRQKAKFFSSLPTYFNSGKKIAQKLATYARQNPSQRRYNSGNANRKVTA
jgi:hypothetical protein